MENKKRLLIVRFGDSKQYRLEFEDNSTHPYVHPNPLAPVEKELNDCLEKEFPGKTFAYYTTPQVTEISWEHRDQYSDYPVLDANAVQEIKNTLRGEIEDMDDVKEINRNAPYDRLNKDALGKD